MGGGGNATQNCLLCDSSGLRLCANIVAPGENLGKVDILQGMDAMHKMAQTSDAAHPDMIYMKIPVGVLQCNCQIIGDPKTLEAIVIDPGDEVERILSMLGRYKLKVKAIISTHAHIDHVGGLAKLHLYTGAPVMMHGEDLPLYHGMEEQAAFIGLATPELTEVDQLLKDGDTLPWGGFQASVIHTPGHTPGSVSLFMPKDGGKVKLAQPQLFAGDTLFAGSIGRTDLWGGSMEQIMESLREKLMQLPDDTLVHPGHGGSTTIGLEKETNPYLK
jgi:hydroxyacylglutathione hydrolase